MLVLAGVAGVWASTLQSMITAPSNEWLLGNGAEFVVAWHTWGVSHPTGYPLQNFLGNVLVRLFLRLGFGNVLSASIVSFVFSLLALLLCGGFIVALAKNSQISPIYCGVVASAVIIFVAFTNMTWLYASVAEVYGLSMALGVGCLWQAMRVWQNRLSVSMSKHILLFGGVFGLAVGHHRTLLLLLPAILFVVAPTLKLHMRAWLAGGALFVLSWAVYAYIWLALSLNSPFIYGTLALNTRDGFLNLLLALERFNELPSEAFVQIQYLPQIFYDRVLALAHEATWFGLALGWVATIVANFSSNEIIRRVGRLLIILQATYMFAPVGQTLIFKTHLPILLVTWSLALGIGFALIAIYTATLNTQSDANPLPLLAYSPLNRGLGMVVNHIHRLYQLMMGGVVVAMIVLGIRQYTTNLPIIRDLITNPKGQYMLDAIKTIPESNPTIIEPWGARYAVFAYGKWVSKELSHVLLYKTNALLEGLPARDRMATILYTTPEALNEIPLTTWTRVFLQPITLRAVADGIVGMDHRAFERPLILRQDPVIEIEVEQARAWFTPDGDVRVSIVWQAVNRVGNDYGVFIYLSDNPIILRDENSIMVRYEQSAPVYGLYPTSRWLSGSRVQDEYRISVPKNMNRTPSQVYFGLSTRVRNFTLPQFMQSIPIRRGA
jgi:hypothetical protein